MNITLIEQDRLGRFVNQWNVRKDYPESYPDRRTTNIQIKLQFDTNGNWNATCDNIRLEIQLNHLLCSSSIHI